jgi:septal ring factor EnvC (AmiA/AmiB activator)
MATKKTPAHKRIKRAETGRDDWKVKASERRLENQKLKKQLQEHETIITELKASLLNAENEKSALQQEITSIKKRN